MLGCKVMGGDLLVFSHQGGVLHVSDCGKLCMGVGVCGISDFLVLPSPPFCSFSRGLPPGLDTMRQPRQRHAAAAMVVAVVLLALGTTPGRAARLWGLTEPAVAPFRGFSPIRHPDAWREPAHTLMAAKPLMRSGCQSPAHQCIKESMAQRPRCRTSTQVFSCTPIVAHPCGSEAVYVYVHVYSIIHWGIGRWFISFPH